MPTKIYEGGARARAQVETYTVGSATNGQIFGITINNKTISYTAGGAETTTTIAAALKALLAATDAPPEFQEITWTQAAAVITMTAKTAGKPVVTAVSASTTGTLTKATTTANVGPEVWSEATNWDGGAIPANGDDVWIKAPVRYDLDNATMMALALASLNIPLDIEDAVGLPEINEDNSSLPYGEYRSTFLRFTVPPTTVNVGDGVDGNGSGLLRLDLGQTANAATTTINVFNTADSVVDGVEALLLKVTKTGTGANTLNVTRGSVGVAVLPGETSTFADGSVRVGYISSQESDAEVRFGSGVAMPATLLKTGGKMTVASNMTTLNHRGGELTVNGAATLTTGNYDKGTINWNSSGTQTTVNGGSDVILNFNGDPRTKIITTLAPKQGFKLIDDQGIVTVTNGIAMTQLDLKIQGELDLSFGPGRTITIT